MPPKEYQNHTNPHDWLKTNLDRMVITNPCVFHINTLVQFSGLEMPEITLLRDIKTLIQV